MENKIKAVTAVCCSLLMISACAGTNGLSDDLFSGGKEPLTMVPVNHTGRYAYPIFVGENWAGNVSAHSGGGGGVCCYPNTDDWSQPVTVKWTWGYERDWDTKKITRTAEEHTAIVHFPPEGPNRSDPDHPETYLCVILRDFDKVDLAFSRSGSACTKK